MRDMRTWRMRTQTRILKASSTPYQSTNHDLQLSFGGDTQYTVSTALYCVNYS